MKSLFALRDWISQNEIRVGLYIIISYLLIKFSGIFSWDVFLLIILGLNFLYYKSFGLEYKNKVAEFNPGRDDLPYSKVITFLFYCSAIAVILISGLKQFFQIETNFSFFFVSLLIFIFTGLTIGVSGILLNSRFKGKYFCEKIVFTKEKIILYKKKKFEFLKEKMVANLRTENLMEISSPANEEEPIIFDLLNFKKKDQDTLKELLLIT